PPLHDVRAEPAHADAADFLVVGQREMQWPLETAAQKFGDERETRRRKAFHVGDAAAGDLVTEPGCREGVRAPWLAVDRDNVGVAGKDDPARKAIAVARGKRSEQIR